MYIDIFAEPPPRAFSALHGACRYLTPSEKAVMICLIGMAYGSCGKPFTATASSVANVTGLTLPPIGTAIRNMVRLGLIKRVRERKGKFPAYYLLNVEALEALGAKVEAESPAEFAPPPVRKRMRRNQ
ncbi:hypothetical protein [Pseudotabrizicola alkalilacus]|uniref:hypothetical protein n=1 Tax=Pseudotabrizicola alkalilacus TaxID=2305252 RepID=UPI0011C11F92|nr:hypothetical protein [Pseudotabrizicola alkalilacus]